jgi:hypothetical protein
MMEEFEHAMRREFWKAWALDYAWVFFTLAGLLCWILS